ncbi:MAG TPA: rhomboid family intramembrane serine protease [Planctomycetaceae bacterium]|nr:rhomboid family intramembrane serine protease [Planctomycetaceae bacterium]
MRQIGTIGNEADAQKLVDYLLTLDIRSQIEPVENAFAVWAIDEDQVARAREEVTHFLENPADPRYERAPRLAMQLRDELIRREKEKRKNIIDVRRRWNVPRARPLTFLLIAASCIVAVATGFGEDERGVIWQKLVIDSYEVSGQSMLVHILFAFDIRHGQIWRLITPIFLHIGPIHLVMNMFAVHGLGTLIESRRGPVRMALMVIVIAIVSNLAQYAWDGPRFAGMSGVAFGMFGYAWIKSEFDPDAGIAIQPSSVAMMLGWFVLCMTGLVGPIANMDHFVGLVAGILLGYGPVIKRRLRG